jgi:hypothetical protein
MFRVVNQPALIEGFMWQFSLNMDIKPSSKIQLGFYTKGQTRVNTQTISQTLGKTQDLTRTIPKARALSLDEKMHWKFFLSRPSCSTDQ